MSGNPAEIGVIFEILPNPLMDRKCSRCNSTDFRAIKFDSLPAPSDTKYAVEPLGTDQSQTLRPLAICLGCKRIVDLQ